MTKDHTIPGYSRYRIETDPFRILDTYRGQYLSIFRRQRGLGQVWVQDDQGQRHQRSILILAALAFHGLQPHGYKAHYVGESREEINPTTVQWWPVSDSYRRNRQALSERNSHRVQALYFDPDSNWTQQALAERFGVSQPTIARIINRERSYPDVAE